MRLVRDGVVPDELRISRLLLGTFGFFGLGLLVLLEVLLLVQGEIKLRVVLRTFQAVGNLLFLFFGLLLLDFLREWLLEVLIAGSHHLVLLSDLVPVKHCVLLLLVDWHAHLLDLSLWVPWMWVSRMWVSRVWVPFQLLELETLRQLLLVWDVHLWHFRPVLNLLCTLRILQELLLIELRLNDSLCLLQDLQWLLR